MASTPSSEGAAPRLAGQEVGGGHTPELVSGRAVRREFPADVALDLDTTEAGQTDTTGDQQDPDTTEAGQTDTTGDQQDLDTTEAGQTDTTGDQQDLDTNSWTDRHNR